MPVGASPEVKYVADRRPLVVRTALGNSSAPGHVNHMHPDWCSPAKTKEWLRDRLLKYNFPPLVPRPGTVQVDRIVFWQITGHTDDSGGWLPFSSWHTLNENQRWAFTEAIRIWQAERPGRTVGLYHGRDAQDPYQLRVPAGGLGSPNSTGDVATRERWWLQQLAPMVSIGIDELWLDAGSEAAFAPRLREITALVERWLHRVPGIEAFPLKREPSGELVIDLDRVACNPTMSWWSNFKPYNWRQWPTIPPNMEAHVIIGATMPTHQDIVDLKAKGWIISYSDAVIPLP
jgi:hypothetical protein